MRTRFLLAAAVASCILTAGDDAPIPKKSRPNPPPQVQRGRELFLKSEKGKPCGTCHTMDGIGASVGPDLTKMATYAMPRGLVIAMRMSMTETVQSVKPVQGPTFPGVLKQKEGDAIEIWDVGQMPPVLRSFKADQISSMKRDEKWKHPPSITSYEWQDVADIVAFLKWAATGSTKPVAAEEVETSQ